LPYGQQAVAALPHLSGMGPITPTHCVSMCLSTVVHLMPASGASTHFTVLGAYMQTGLYPSHIGFLCPAADAEQR
jgi:hypothetical protein